MDIVTALLALTCGALVVYAFDRLGAMIPDSSWGGLYVLGWRSWTAGRPPRSTAGDGPSPTFEDSNDPVDGVMGVTGAAPRWLG